MLPKRTRLMWVFLLLPALLLACGLGKRTPANEIKVPVSQEAADRLKDKLEEAFNGDEDTFSLEVTDVELTSFVVLEMSEQVDRADDMLLEDFQVRFAEGQMLLSGKVTAVCPFELNVKAAASAQVEDGQLGVSVNKAQTGMVPLPKWVLEGLSRTITESIVEAPDHMEKAVEIADLKIGEGVMRISGRVVESGE
jgi:hypothetical protein